MKEGERERENGEWKRVTENKRNRRRKGMGGGRVDEENDIRHLAMRIKTDAF